MIDDDFYATIKLKTGEEIFALVTAIEEEDCILLILSGPIVVSQIKSRNGIVGYQIEPWLKTTTEDMFVLNMDNVMTLSECKDVEIISMHQTYIRKVSTFKNKKTSLSRKMGYISNVKDAKARLENLYNKS